MVTCKNKQMKEMNNPDEGKEKLEKEMGGCMEKVSVFIECNAM
jgi:hypothetical protein